MSHTTARTDLSEAEQWCASWDVPVVDGVATLYKVTDAHGVSGRGYDHPTRWAVGEVVTCDDWVPHNHCGNGLHLGPTIHAAFSYRSSGHFWNHRMFRVEVAVDQLVPISMWFGGRLSDKCKVPSCRVVAEETDFYQRMYRSHWASRFSTTSPY